MTATKIKTRGYSGPGTQFQYLPPGELAVADETSVSALTVTQELADYLVGIGIGEVIEDILEASDPAVRPTPEIAVAVEMPEFSVTVDNPGSFVFKPDIDHDIIPQEALDELAAIPRNATLVLADAKSMEWVGPDMTRPDLAMVPPRFTRDSNAPDGGTWYDLTDATRNELLEMIDRTEIDLPGGYQSKADLIALITDSE